MQFNQHERYWSIGININNDLHKFDADEPVVLLLNATAGRRRNVEVEDRDKSSPLHKSFEQVCLQSS